MRKYRRQILSYVTLFLLVFFLVGCKSVTSFYKKTKGQYTFDATEVVNSPKKVYSNTFKKPPVLSKDFIWGINGHTNNIPAYYAPNSLKFQIELLKELQLTHYRINVTLGKTGEVDHWKSETLRWHNTVEQCQSSGIQLLPVIIFKQADYQLSEEKIYNQARRQGKGFAKRYKNIVAAYALGNEMDLEIDIDGKDGSKLEHYNLKKGAKVISFLKGMAAGIREEDPTAKLIINGAGRHRYGYYEYIKQQKVDYDIIGFHWYSEMGKVAAPYLSEKDGLDIMQYMHEQFQKPIWITEINQHWGVIKHPEEHQAFWMDHFIDNLEGRDYIKAFFVYELLDEPHLDDGEGYENPRQAYFGIIDWLEPYKSYRYRPAAITYKYKIEEVKRGLQHYVSALGVKLFLSKEIQKQLLAMLQKGTSPQKVLQFAYTANTPEALLKATITEVYQTLLNRNPTQKEENYWNKQTKNESSKQTVITGLLSSQEFYKNAIITGYNLNNTFPFLRNDVYILKK